MRDKSENLGMGYLHGREFPLEKTFRCHSGGIISIWRTNLVIVSGFG